MRLLPALALLGSATSTAPLHSAHLRAVPVCQVARNAEALIGKRVRVEGYVLNLSSHGLVLTAKRRDCDAGQLSLWTELVDSDPAWRAVFPRSFGPRRAILVGTVRWQPARFGSGRNPALTVERVDYLSRINAKDKDF